MRAVVQRVSSAKVTVEGEVVGEIGLGYLVLLGVTGTDTRAEAALLAGKVAKLRVFRDQQDKMNLSVLDVGGKVLVVSQFTLYADTAKGNRPSFTDAAPPGQAEELYEYFSAELSRLGVGVAQGVFGAHMAVSLLNDGPVTICLDTAAWARR